jgi:carbon-monoxide dehydrogenase small subunit
MRVELTVNGEPRTLELPPLTRLLDALRTMGPAGLGLTGTKEGCGEGECGSCTVLLDGEPVNSCLVAIGQCHGREVVTVEGLSHSELTPLQQCMSDHGGAQCGVCTPGMLIAAEWLLRRTPRPQPEDVRRAISGNICRCTGYDRIVASVLEAAKLRSGGAP